MNKIKTFLYLWIAAALLAGCNSSEVSEGTVDQAITPPQTVQPVVKRSITETKATNWYIRLVAEIEDQGLVSSDAQLGVLDEDNATSKHTLSAFPPAGSNYLDVVFSDPVGMPVGDYKTYFQQFADGAEYRWRFTVHTDNSNAQIALSWRGIYVLTPYIDEQGRQRYRETRSMTNPVIKNMRLKDLQTGTIVTVLSGDAPKVYYFNMNGSTERSFEWIQLPDSAIVPEGTK